MQEHWIQFAASVNQITAGKFINEVTTSINNGVKKINILLSTGVEL